jgi:peptidoglycan/LPS O-acetylase OafA/YrhL
MKRLNLHKYKIITLGLFVISVLSTIAAAQTSYDMGYNFPGGIWLIGIIIWFIVWILVAIWVYRDAEKRGKNKVLWLIIVILIGIIGLIIWLVIRGDVIDKAGGRKCLHCGREIPEDAMTCPYCGTKFNELPK